MARTNRQPTNVLPMRAPAIHHFAFSGTWGADYRLQCWCGKSHRVSTAGWRVMTEGLNRFLSAHEACVAAGQGETLDAIQHVVREELLATGATPEQLTRGMRRLMACISHSKDNPCDLCKDDE